MVKTYSGVNNPILVPIFGLVWEDFTLLGLIFLIFFIMCLILLLFSVTLIAVITLGVIGTLIFVGGWQLCRRIYRWFEGIPRDGVIYGFFSYLLSNKRLSCRLYGSDHHALFVFSGGFLPWKIIPNPRR